MLQFSEPWGHPMGGCNRALADLRSDIKVAVSYWLGAF